MNIATGTVIEKKLPYNNNAISCAKVLTFLTVSEFI